MERSMIEWLWKAGKMPDWAYYQQNGKTATENWQEQTARFYAQLTEKSVEQQVAEQLPPLLETTMEKLLHDFL